MSTAVHRSRNKLWRSNSIFNLWPNRFIQKKSKNPSHCHISLTILILMQIYFIKHLSPVELTSTPSPCFTPATNSASSYLFQTLIIFFIIILYQWKRREWKLVQCIWILKITVLVNLQRQATVYIQECCIIFYRPSRISMLWDCTYV